MIGRVVAHYRILEELGRGGMGVVYKAADTRLERFVALKFLPKGLNTVGGNGDSPRERFKREARAASSLEHPNICTIHEIDETEDQQTYMVMPCYHGETLKEKLEKGPLEATEAADIARQIAAGLHKAHEQGIVHRDIKPANIFVTTDKVVKILDFGLAKLTGPSQLTRTGTTLGTVAYMAPEQARGESVDPRTDIWSLGVVLYQMLTGRLPFRGDYDQAVIYAILNEEPSPPSTIGKDIDAKWDPIVQRTLAKDPDQRFPDMMEVMEALQRPAYPTATTDSKEKSIIVLPFEDISPGKDNEYFSDGLTEEIITDLSHIHDLLVISRNSAMTFKGSNRKTREIAADVKVRYVLEGSVRKAGNNLRITAQLIDAQTDAHVWAQKFSGTLDDIFDIQEKVSRSIVDALTLTLSPEEDRRISAHPIENAPAYELYLKANAEIFKFTQEAIDRAIGYLQNALAIIGDNALLYSGLAFAYFNLVNIGMKQEEYLAKALEYVHKALEMDPEFPKAHVVLGWIYCLGELSRSIQHLKKALAITPEDAMALGVLAMDYIGMGHISLATGIVEKLMAIDPLDYPTHYSRGALYFYNGQYEKALEAWKKLYQMYPESAYSKWSYALALIYNNHMDRAFAIIDQHARTDPDNVLAKLGLMLKYGLQKDKRRAYGEMTADFKQTCQRTYTFSHHLAGVFAMLDEKEEALIWIKNAVDRGFMNYPMLVDRDPLLKNIRKEPRFKKLMEQVKKAWEAFGERE